MVKKKVDRYFYVSGDKPTGLPNSFVVSKGEAEIGIKTDQRTSDRYRLDNMN